MADKDDDLELEVEVTPGDPVEIDLDTGETAKPVAEAKVEDKPEPKVEDEGVKSLKEQLAASRAAQEEKDRLIRAAEERANKAEVKVGESQYQVVLSAIETIKHEAAQAKKAWARAQEEGRYEEAGDFMEKVALAASRMDQLESAKQNFAEREPQRTEGAVKRSEPIAAPAPADPVEHLARQLSPKSADWVRQHPECAQDPVVFQEMVAADARAKRLGFAPDTPQYFDFIEKRLGFKEEVQEARPEPAEPERKRSVAAPVSREVPGGAVAARRITLTAEEQEIAQMNGMTNKEYAEEKMKMLAEKARAMN